MQQIQDIATTSTQVYIGIIHTYIGHWTYNLACWTLSNLTAFSLFIYLCTFSGPGINDCAATIHCRRSHHQLNRIICNLRLQLWVHYFVSLHLKPLLCIIVYCHGTLTKVILCVPSFAIFSVCTVGNNSTPWSQQRLRCQVGSRAWDNLNYPSFCEEV